MKPYILDDRNVIVAKIVPVALLALIFVASYNLLVETKSIGVIIVLKIGLIGLTIVNSIELIEHLINYIKYKDVYLRVDEDGVFINSGNLSETVTWNRVKEIYFRRTGKTLSLIIYYCCPLKVSEQRDIHPQCCCNGIADDFSEGKPLS